MSEKTILDKYITEATKEVEQKSKQKQIEVAEPAKEKAMSTPTAEELQKLWDDWKASTPQYLETVRNNALMEVEVTRLYREGHGLESLCDLAMKILAARNELTLVPLQFVRKKEPSGAEVYTAKTFGQDSASSGTLRHDGHISVLKIKEWETERAEQKQFEEIQAKLEATKAEDAELARQSANAELEGELPLSLMDSPSEEARVLSLPSVTPAKIRDYIRRKQAEQMKRLQDNAKSRR